MVEKKKGLKKEVFYKVNTTYSITINVDDKHQGKLLKTSYGKLNYVKNIVKEVFNEYLDIRYILHLDISEPREINLNSSRIHFHGCINFKNEIAIRDWLLMVLPKLASFCYINIDTIDDMKVWEEYCKKYDSITQIIPINNGLSWKNNNVDSLPSGDRGL